MPGNPFVIRRKKLFVDILLSVVRFSELESISQDNSLERMISCDPFLFGIGGSFRILLVEKSVESFLDIDGCDVVGEQHDLICVEFVFVFVEERIVSDQIALEKPGDESSGSGKRIDQVDVFVGNRNSEFVLEEILDGRKKKPTTNKH